MPTKPLRDPEYEALIRSFCELFTEEMMRSHKDTRFVFMFIRNGQSQGVDLAHNLDTATLKKYLEWTLANVDQYDFKSPTNRKLDS